MNVQPMMRPGSRFAMESNILLLREALRAGKRYLTPDHRTTDSIDKLRKLPNGRIDLLSVDESARLLANMQRQFDLESED